MASSKAAVWSAIIGNSAVMVAKFGAFSVTGSGAMLSEGIHSFADVMNQSLLAFGIKQSEREADPDHPYGFGQARFAWALISAVGIFFLGSGVTLYHGIDSLLHPHAMEGHGVALAVLLFSFVVEGGTFMVALRAVQQQAAAVGMGLGEYMRRGRDPMGVSVLLEDGAAVVGVTIAAAAVGASQVTGSPVYDSVGSILIGLLLGGIAIFLVRKNMDYLLGKAIRPELQSRIVDVLLRQPTVDKVHDIKATVMSAEHVRFKADIEFAGEALVERWLVDKDLDALAVEAADPQGLRSLLMRFGDELVDSVGDEVDRLEKEIRDAVPDAQYVDLESN